MTEGPLVRRIRLALGRMDHRLLAAAVQQRSPVTDQVMTTASGMANRSMLWLAMSGVLAATGRRRARTAAASGLLGIGIAATLVNGPLKFAWRRDRPPGGSEPLLPLPRTFSFPSGHAASASAFAAGATAALPTIGPLVVPMAATVAYSRVHTGVHYPSDVLVGAAVGAGSGLLGARVVRRVRESRAHRVDAPTLDAAAPRHAVLVTSKDAGAADALPAARRALEAAGIDIAEVVSVEDVDRLAALVQSADAAPLVIAAGGDGTVSAAAGAIVGSAAVLAIIPLGTSNDVARSLGIPADAVDAAQLLAEARVCAVDAGSVELDGGDSRVFVNAATVGLNVDFARTATKSGLRNQFGRLIYPIAAARALRGYRPFECTVEYGERSDSMSAVHVSVSNAPVFGGVLEMRVPGASITDGLLDVIIVERLSIARLVLAVADAVIGGHRPVHRVHAMRVRHIRVHADRQELALDGEVVGALPASFEIRPDALLVAVPPSTS